MLQEGAHHSHAESGHLFNIGKQSVLTKQETLMGKGCLCREQEGQGNQENCSAFRPTVSGFRVMGLVSGLSWPIILTQGSSWWCKHCSAKMNASKKGSGR